MVEDETQNVPAMPAPEAQGAEASGVPASSGAPEAIALPPPTPAEVVPSELPTVSPAAAPVATLPPQQPPSEHASEAALAANAAYASSIFVSPDEFAEDLEMRLGRANGNIYHRRPGVEGVHDGQVMVRLKKKRFIVIDYSVAPTEADMQAAALSPHMACPNGAGRTACHTPECNKIGVPVLLFDSDPEEPASLYLRSGLCFTCQRHLNEKRRTQRKRPSTAGDEGDSSTAAASAIKKLRVNGNVSSEDALVIPGTSATGAKPHSDTYQYPQIATDLQQSIQSASADVHRLLAIVSTSAVPVQENHNETITQSHAAPAPETEATVNGDDHKVLKEHEGQTEQGQADEMKLQHPKNEVHVHPPSSEDITVSYDRAYLSLSKAIYLLTQWKASWDGAVAAAVAQEAVSSDPRLVDAVATGAAMAAGDMVGAGTQELDTNAGNAASNLAGNSANMVSLLLAADQRKEGPARENEMEVADMQVKAFEV